VFVSGAYDASSPSLVHGFVVDGAVVACVGAGSGGSWVVA
jgi:hypothetical protein